MIPRRLLFPDNSFAHVCFRCHNRQFFFKPVEIKKYFVSLLARYHIKYSIKIFEFIVMDNHVHLLLKAPSADHLGQFMRIVNSLLAKFVNAYYQRDSQVIKERYKSPIITTDAYFLKTMQYIWLNRHKIDGQDPSKDPFCSVSWRLDSSIPCKLASNAKEAEMLEGLLAEYKEFPLKFGKSVVNFISDLLSEALSAISDLLDELFEHTHTIGDEEAMSYRSQWLNACKSYSVKWVPI